MGTYTLRVPRILTHCLSSEQHNFTGRGQQLHHGCTELICINVQLKVMNNDI